MLTKNYFDMIIYYFVEDDMIATIEVSDNNIHIDNSYLISKKDFIRLLKYISDNCQNEVLKHRTMSGLYCEWIAHNFLYKIGYKQDRTKDVDLDYPQNWKYRIGFALLGILTWIFVK